MQAGAGAGFVLQGAQVCLDGEGWGGGKVVAVWKHEGESLRTPDSGVGWEEVERVLAGNRSPLKSNLPIRPTSVGAFAVGQ